MTALRTSAQTAMLRAVHERPRATRASIAHELGMPSVSRPRPSRGWSPRGSWPRRRRRRPAPAAAATALHAHPDGPLVAVAAITQETWQFAEVQLGDRRRGGVRYAPPPGEAGPRGGGRRTEHAGARFGTRIRAAAVSVPGTVVGRRLVNAPNLGWHDVDLSALWPRYDPDVPLIAGNDATFAAIAESRHGAGSARAAWCTGRRRRGRRHRGRDRVVAGATGTAGEFGHMPFGDPARRCRCGATGCWNTSLDGYALARALHQPEPADDEVATSAGCWPRRGPRQPAAAEAIQAASRAFGRGARPGQRAGPAPDHGGRPGPEFLDVAGEHVTAAYHDGLMASARCRHPRWSRHGCVTTARCGGRPSNASARCSATTAYRPGPEPGTGWRRPG